MKASIEENTCVGHGLCYLNAPEVFTDDEEGYGQVIGDGEIPAEHVAGARVGAASCPERAITLRE